jgi:molybdopterin molybdotransferase
MLTPSEATAVIDAALAPLAAETCELGAAAGRVLREDLVAERDQPPFDRIAMDGIALAHAAWHAGRREFRITGTAAAGRQPPDLSDPTACVEVMTGAMRPSGADCVVPVELYTVRDGVACLGDEPVAPVAHIHARGIDSRAGDPVLAAGTRLRGPELAIAASVGRSRIEVSRPVRIAVVSTGDELVGPDVTLLPWQIRRSNAFGIRGLLQAAGHTDIVDDHLVDDREALAVGLGRHLATRDVLILSGGVSAGRFDFVPDTLTQLGVRCVFHKVAQRPGKPLWFGIGPANQAVFALPGNPVSTLVCLTRYVLPALQKLMGAAPAQAPSIRLAEPWSSRIGLTTFLPVDRADDACFARPRTTHGSGDFTALRGTAGFVELAPGRDYSADVSVPFYAW